MKKSLTLIEKISSECSDNITYYRYNTNIPDTLKYKKGRITAASWINEICFYFIQKEKSFLEEFTTILKAKESDVKELTNEEYKQGLLDEINETKTKLENKRFDK